MKNSTITLFLLCMFCYISYAQTEIHLSDYPFDSATDISDYERIIRAAKAAYNPRKTLVLSDDLCVHKPLVFDSTKVDSSKTLTRSIRGTGFCTITAIQHTSYEWQAQDAVIKVVRSNQGAHFRLEKIAVDAAGIADYGFAFQNITNGTFRDLKATNARRGGMVIEACQTSQFDNLESTQNDGFGILMIRCNAAHFNHIKTTVNGGDGLVITSDTTQHALPLLIDTARLIGSGGLWIYGLHSENNGYQRQGQEPSSPQRGHGVVLYEIPGGVHIDGGWLEENAGDAIYLENCSNSSISNLRIIVPNCGATTYAPRWIRIQGNRSWANAIEHNHLETENGVKELGMVAVQYPVWSSNAIQEVSFHGQKHLMSKIENEEGIRPQYPRSTTYTNPRDLPLLLFKNEAGDTIAKAYFLNVFDDCLQFVELEVMDTLLFSNQSSMIWDRSLNDIDPLQNAAKVFSSSNNWQADIVYDVNNRKLIAVHPLNRNFFKHNWFHSSAAPLLTQLQHYIILGDNIDGRVLTE